jgi:hypothetical protein
MHPILHVLAVLVATGSTNSNRKRSPSCVRRTGAFASNWHSTIRRILQEHGLEPAPQRHLPWSMFLRTHGASIAAVDFFTVEARTLGGLTRYHVFFVIELATRRDRVAGMTDEPCGEWLRRVTLPLVDTFDGFPLGHQYLIHDHDPLFGGSFASLLR